jgi:hypothetical protein
VSDLADLAFEVAGDLPANVRKVIDTATREGWDLNPPGMTLALRLNHPTDDLAQPVYIVWAVGRTAKGRMSFRFDSAGTRGLVPLNGVELLEYLSDPTIAITMDEEAQGDLESREKPPAWDDSKPPERNVADVLGGTIVSIGRDKPKTAAQILAETKRKAVASSNPLKAAPPALRVSPPSPRS